MSFPPASPSTPQGFRTPKGSAPSPTPARISPLTPSPVRKSPSVSPRLTVTTRHTPLWSFVAIVLFWAVFINVLLFVGDLAQPELVSTCKFSPYKRELNPDSLQTAAVSVDVRYILFFFGPRLVLLGFLVMLWKVSLNKLALILSAALLFWVYFPGLYILETIKRLSGDWECHTRKPNGISGHFYYIAYHVVMVNYLSALLHRKIASASLAWLRIPATLLAVFCLAVEGFFCFWYGYHSLKQIAYGAIYGLVVAAIAVAASEVLWMRLTSDQSKEKKRQ